MVLKTQRHEHSCIDKACGEMKLELTANYTHGFTAHFPGTSFCLCDTTTESRSGLYFLQSQFILTPLLFPSCSGSFPIIMWDEHGFSPNSKPPESKCSFSRLRPAAAFQLFN